MVRKYNNHKLQTNPWHREEDSYNNHEAPGKQTKQNSRISIPRYKIETDWVYLSLYSHAAPMPPKLVYPTHGAYDGVVNVIKLTKEQTLDNRPC